MAYQVWYIAFHLFYIFMPIFMIHTILMHIVSSCVCEVLTFLHATYMSISIHVSLLLMCCMLKFVHVASLFICATPRFLCLLSCPLSFLLYQHNILNFASRFVISSIFSITPCSVASCTRSIPKFAYYNKKKYWPKYNESQKKEKSYLRYPESEGW